MGGRLSLRRQGSVQTAQEMLGLDKVKETTRVQKQEKAESEGMYASANEEHICDECGFFDAENNHCLNTGEPRLGGQKGCWQYGRE